MKDALEFLKAIDGPKLTAADRARAILWWVGRDDVTTGMSVTEVCDIIQAAGHPKQNVSRLATQLSADKKHLAKIPGANGWRLKPHARVQLDAQYDGVVGKPRAVKSTDSILPSALVAGSRRYLEKVVHQINVSYDIGLYDCSAVMCRRLLETLIIEVYEKDGRARDIQAGDGHFFMFADLLRTLLKDPKFNLSRNGRKGLEDFKKLGDLSAHNRRFNAQRSDIDTIQSGLRVAAEELLHLASLA